MKLNIDFMKWAPIAAGTIAAISLMACSSSTPSSQPGAASDAHALQLAGQGKNQEAADEYARIGELLLMPEGLEYADKEFAKAIALVPNHPKANFYKATTEPALLAKGFIPRSERLLTNERDLKDLERFRGEVEKLKMPEVTRFANYLPSGERPFVTYYDVQRFERERVLPAILASIDKLAKIDLSAGPMKLNFTPARLQIDPVRDHTDYYSSYCSYDPRTGYKCEYWDYHYGSKKARNEYFVDKYDLQIIRNAFEALAGEIRIATAYSYKDSEFAIRRLRAIDALRREQGRGGLNTQDVVTTLREFNDLLTLERDHQLVEVHRSASQILRDNLDLANLDDKLCKSYHDTDRNDGNSLIHPICYTINDVKNLQTGLDMLAGPKEIELGRDVQGRKVMIVMDITRVLANPVKDLKALFPTTFDAVGAPVDYPDTTMGGLFPNGDVIEKFKQLGNTSNRGFERGFRRALRNIKDHV